MAQFKPMLKHFDKDGYYAAKKIVDEKISAFDKAVEWASQYIDIKDVEAFEVDMIAEFKRSLLYKHEKSIGLPINAEKLIDLLDIPIYEFNRIATQYYEIGIDTKFLDGVLTAEVDKADYQLWTVSEEQNEKLRIGREFIKSVEHLSDYTKVYPFDVARGVSQLISYDIRSQKYFVNV
jgi:hypothetical protein